MILGLEGKFRRSSSLYL